MMVSDFITLATPSCHLELTEEQIEAQKHLPKAKQVVERARRIIYPSSKEGADDWWNMEQMIAQVSQTSQYFCIPNSLLG